MLCSKHTCEMYSDAATGQAFSIMSDSTRQQVRLIMAEVPDNNSTRQQQ